MSENKVFAEQSERRSFIYRKLANSSATWEQNNGYALISQISDIDTELHYAHELALCDLSYLSRIGFKGNGTNEWLTKQKITIPTKTNNTNILENGCLIARLGSNDMLIMDNTRTLPSLKHKILSLQFMEIAEA